MDSVQLWRLLHWPGQAKYLCNQPNKKLLDLPNRNFFGTNILRNGLICNQESD